MKKGAIEMKKVFKMQHLDCANCAAKMERAISKIDGVNKVTISFMTQKLSIEAEEERLAEIMEKALEACRKIDRDCRILMD